MILMTLMILMIKDNILQKLNREEYINTKGAKKLALFYM